MADEPEDRTSFLECELKDPRLLVDVSLALSAAPAQKQLDRHLAFELFLVLASKAVTPLPFCAIHRSCLIEYKAAEIRNICRKQSARVLLALSW